ncbi:MAG: pullulanase [Candidatus Marinimicrobia bacterium]|nr:pullulanase [Candidatus Neomarinimicrobiota bacterium]
MSPRKFILSMVPIIMMAACSNNPELLKDMTSNSKSIEAVDEKLGLIRSQDGAIFRLFAPTEALVNLVLFQKFDDDKGESHAMTMKPNGVWEISLPQAKLTKFYAYSAPGSDQHIIPDPYSHAVVRQNHFKYPSKTVILPRDEFDWQGTETTSASIGDLVILEAHLRDMTVHPSSGAISPGTYKGFIEPGQKGGIQHLKDMGYNAVEFLPLQEFGNIEIDYKNSELSTWNDWNPYEANHWGYMTSFFFAPEIYYGSDGLKDRGAWVGEDGRAVNEMKEMVRALHKEGISIILDVVYNHVSQYDDNPFKLIDKDYYFRLDEEGDYLSHSGCGNDFKTENAMSRKMIIESLLHWMNEYHIDGFRFDLAAMIDLETVDAITAATQAVNPDVILIGEPWGGGGYNPKELADHGWASWNDHFRNGVKGRNPRESDSGFIFGKFWDGKDREYYKKLMRGYLQSEGGHFQDPSQSVNYLESHDDNTMGDFIRLVLGKVGASEVVTRDQVARLSEEELTIHKLAALNLLTSQGPVMIAQGQSWGRAKVIANSIGIDPHAGQLDHNSYEKDDETNWLNWDEKELNSSLVDYYRGLISIRNNYPELRNVKTGFRKFLNGSNPLSYGVSMVGEHRVMVLLNADKKSTSKFSLPTGTWTILANGNHADTEGLGKVEYVVEVVAQSGLILVK